MPKHHPSHDWAIHNMKIQLARLFTTLQTQFFLALVIGGIVPLGLGGALLIALDQQTLTTQSARELTGLARGLGAELDHFVDTRLHDAQGIAALFSDTNLRPVSQEALLKTLFAEFTEFHRIAAFDTRGNRLAASQPGGAAQRTITVVFQAAATRGQQGWEIALDPDTQQRALLLYTPIRNRDQQVVGVIESVVDLNDLVTLVGQTQVGGRRAFVVDQTGRALLHPEHAVMLHPEQYSWDALKATTPLADSGTFSYLWQGTPYVAAYTPVAQLGWTVVVEQTEATLIAPVLRARAIGMSALLLSIGLALIIAYFAARRITAPLRQLATATQAFGAGDANTPLPTARLRAKELRVLVSAFSDMRTTISETLRQSEAETHMLALVASRTDNAVIIADHLGRIEWVNAGFTRITGYMLDEIRGKTPGHILQGPDSDAATIEHMRAQLRNGAGFSIEIINYRKDGSPYWIAIEVQPIRDVAGQVVRFMALQSDITARKQIEQQLQFQNALLTAQSESAIDGILVVSPERGLVSFNRRFTELFGLSQAATLPHDSAEMLAVLADKVANFDQFTARLDERYANQLGCAWDEVCLLDGTVLERYTAPVTGSDGAYYGRIWFYRDITSRTHTENELRAAKDEAERANRAKSEFLSRMSHELRTPLHAILGFAQLLELDQVSDEQRSSVVLIIDAGRHLLELINEVLDITSIETGHLSFSPEPIQLYHEMSEAVELVRPLTLARQIQLTLPPTAHFREYVKADHQRLKQVFVNLLSNAIKYNRAAGIVTITCAIVAEDRIRIMIADQGDGIPPEKLARLFTPFDRLDAANSNVEGTGLGLVLSKRLVEMMGGQIGVSSLAGQDSQFWVELMRAQPNQPRQNAFALLDNTNPIQLASTATVLYIEDNNVSIVLIEHILKHQRGIQCLSCRQGQLGVQLAKEHQPDLILLDLHLPDMFGAEILCLLQADPATRQIPVVILSTEATPGQTEDLLRNGARAYLIKPINIRRFLEVVDTLLTGK